MLCGQFVATCLQQLECRTMNHIMAVNVIYNDMCSGTTTWMESSTSVRANFDTILILAILALKCQAKKRNLLCCSQVEFRNI